MSRTSVFLKQHPMCCFCGGCTPATSIDHQPARIIFPEKHRPKGLEFPACAVCNGQTSADEALLAFICRFAGSFGAKAAHDFSRLKQIVHSINHSFPGLLRKMPEVNLAACRIAAKLALAVYYDNSSGSASKDCRINGPIAKTAMQSNTLKTSLRQFPRQRPCRRAGGKLTKVFSQVLFRGWATVHGRCFSRISGVDSAATRTPGAAALG
jgi:hypothetical protein